MSAIDIFGGDEFNPTATAKPKAEKPSKGEDSVKEEPKKPDYVPDFSMNPVERFRLEYGAKDYLKSFGDILLKSFEDESTGAARCFNLNGWTAETLFEATRDKFIDEARKLAQEGNSNAVALGMTDDKLIGTACHIIVDEKPKPKEEPKPAPSKPAVKEEPKQVAKAKEEKPKPKKEFEQINLFDFI